VGLQGFGRACTDSAICRKHPDCCAADARQRQRRLFERRGHRQRVGFAFGRRRDHQRRPALRPGARWRQQRMQFVLLWSHPRHPSLHSQ
jgi:hypothetical protein